MTVATDRRPFSCARVLIVPVNTVHGFDYGMDSDGWVLTVMITTRSNNPGDCRQTIMNAACITIHADTAWIDATNVALGPLAKDGQIEASKQWNPVPTRFAIQPSDSYICLPNTRPVVLNGIPASGIRFCAQAQTTASSGWPSGSSHCQRCSPLPSLAAIRLLKVWG